MGELLERRMRATANNQGGAYATTGRLFSYAYDTYFYTGWLRDDGTELVRIVTARNVVLADANGRRIAEPEFRLADHDLIYVMAERFSAAPRDTRLELDFIDAKGRPTWAYAGDFDAYQIDLLADFDRDGAVDDEQPTADWTWGRTGLGAILMVNSDRDASYPSPDFRDRLDRDVNGPLDLEDMTEVVLRMSGPPGRELSDCQVRLHVSDAAASRLRAFDLSRGTPEAAIGPGMSTASLPANRGRRRFAVEGLDFPDSGFSGLITISADVECDGERLAGTEILLRVAPWLALPNTQPVERIFIAEMIDGSNANAIRDMELFSTAAGVPLERVADQLNQRDRWLQDEIEIGFAATPAKAIPVVLDSPRNRGLDRFPERRLLGPDFAYVTRGNDRQASSLDSFGNLDCTPPHEGPSGAFPFGRVLFGGAQPGGAPGRRMMKVVRDFAYAQVVQAPIELYSDWLAVGHVDEFMSFVPAVDMRGFRLVLASPRLATSVLERVAAEGGENLWLMEGRSKARRVGQLLRDRTLAAFNVQCQRSIDWNRNRLTSEMGLTAGEILEVPMLYQPTRDGAASVHPNPVNMQVANGHLAIPKPFGPRPGGACVFEQVIESIYHPLGLTTHFIDTYDGYFLLSGEIHCGTNVVRSPFETQGWWCFEPEEPKRPGARR